MSRSSVATSKDKQYDIFTMCELLYGTYQQCISAQSTVDGFKRMALCIPIDYRRESIQIRPEHFTSSSVHRKCIASLLQTWCVISAEEAIVEQPDRRFETCKELRPLFRQREAELSSDDTVSENGTVRVSKTAGDILKSDSVFQALSERKERRYKKEQVPVQSQVDCEERVALKHNNEKSRIINNLKISTSRVTAKKLSFRRSSSADLIEGFVLMLQESIVGGLQRCVLAMLDLHHAEQTQIDAVILLQLRNIDFW